MEMSQKSIGFFRKLRVAKNALLLLIFLCFLGCAGLPSSPSSASSRAASRSSSASGRQTVSATAQQSAQRIQARFATRTRAMRDFFTKTVPGFLKNNWVSIVAILITAASCMLILTFIKKKRKKSKKPDLAAITAIVISGIIIVGVLVMGPLQKNGNFEKQRRPTRRAALHTFNTELCLSDKPAAYGSLG